MGLQAGRQSFPVQLSIQERTAHRKRQQENASCMFSKGKWFYCVKIYPNCTDLSCVNVRSTCDIHPHFPSFSLCPWSALGFDENKWVVSIAKNETKKNVDQFAFTRAARNNTNILCHARKTSGARVKVISYPYLWSGSHLWSRVHVLPCSSKSFADLGTPALLFNK